MSFIGFFQSKVSKCKGILWREEQLGSENHTYWFENKNCPELSQKISFSQCLNIFSCNFKQIQNL